MMDMRVGGERRGRCGGGGGVGGAPVSSDQLSRRKMPVSVDRGSSRAPILRENADAVSHTMWLWNVPVNMASRPGTVVRKS
jgi:hypothetical protein